MTALEIRGWSAVALGRQFECSEYIVTTGRGRVGFVFTASKPSPYYRDTLETRGGAVCVNQDGTAEIDYNY